MPTAADNGGGDDDNDDADDADDVDVDVDAILPAELPGTMRNLHEGQMIGPSATKVKSKISWQNPDADADNEDNDNDPLANIATLKEAREKWLGRQSSSKKSAGVRDVEPPNPSDTESVTLQRANWVDETSGHEPADLGHGAAHKPAPSRKVKVVVDEANLTKHERAKERSDFAALVHAGVVLFNRDPVIGVKHLIMHGCIEDDPASIAQVLVETEGLSRKRIGEYFGDVFGEHNIEVLKKYACGLCMEDMDMPRALRMYDSPTHTLEHPSPFFKMA